MGLLPADPLVLQISEGLRHVVVQLLVVGLDLGLAVLDGILELHRGQLVEGLAHRLSNHVPRNLEGKSDILKMSHLIRKFQNRTLLSDCAVDSTACLARS